MVKIDLKNLNKSLIVLLITIALGGCSNNDIILPSFMEPDWEPTDVIIQDHIQEAIQLYGNDKIDVLSFQMSVRTFESDFRTQVTHVKPMTPQFFISMEQEFEILFNSTERFFPVRSNEANYLKQTLLRLEKLMLGSMALSNRSLVLNTYFNSLDTRMKDYDFEYKLNVVEVIVESLETERDFPIKKTELELMLKNLKETGSPFMKKDIKLGLRYALKSIEELIFLMDERLLHIDLLRVELERSRNVFISNDGSFVLFATIAKIKESAWLAKEDYPFVMGNGYVEVMPTDTYRVRQYGTSTDKIYVFEEFVYRYKRKQEKFIWGSFTLEDSRMEQTIGKYVTELEVYRVSKNTYLLGNEILIKE